MSAPMPTKPIPDWEQVKGEWVQVVEGLVSDIDGWCRDRGWPTRKLYKSVVEPSIGGYLVPALRFQIDLTKLMLEPVARFVSGADGLADLYKMPEYDDVASVYRLNDGWWIREAAAADGDGRPLDAEAFAAVVLQMVAHADAPTG